MIPAALQTAIASVPPGAWAVGVSGGADSVALLRLLAGRSDLRLVVVHLDHQTRQGASGDDARFVAALGQQLKVDCVQQQRSEIEPLLTTIPRNLSARYRACRLMLYQQVVDQHQLAGVLLAHHADDQAQTVLHQLLRGSGAGNLGGMSPDGRVGRLRIVRPLLGVDRQKLRGYLADIGQVWCEDVSNRDDHYARNRHRQLLDQFPQVNCAVLELAESMRALQQWIQAQSPQLPQQISLAQLADWPRVVQIQALRRWLIAAGTPPAAVERPVLARLWMMAHDAAAPAQQDFPGPVRVRRRQGVLLVEKGMQNVRSSKSF
ncbi:MAG: tRNA lysidine(34) synthetase TilS [Phycisphaerales bacterium]|nr:tRNA lysidine(34) synthetase TilS [Phycisphaerales bacterium]